MKNYRLDHGNGGGFSRLQGRTCAALALALSLLAAPVLAQDAVTLGDYIYVPQRSSEAIYGNETTVRVSGAVLSEDGAQALEPLAGVTLGVYVQNAQGQMTPWANPLSPMQPLRVTTTAQDTTLSLPAGEFYLRVESVPAGYFMPEDGFYPLIADGMVEVTCVQPSQIVVQVSDLAGGVYAGVAVTLTDASGECIQAVTDENGTALFADLKEGTYTVGEEETPPGALPLEEGTTVVTLGRAQRARVELAHPQQGRIRVAVTAYGVDENGAAFERALTDVSVRLSDTEGKPVAQAEADELGVVEMPLPEGVYRLHIETSQDDFALSFSDAMAQVHNGMTTPVDLRAAQKGGRIVLNLTGAGEDWTRTALSLVDEKGNVFGPYSADAQGRVVTPTLAAGAYTLRIDALEEGVQADDTLLTPEGEVSLRSGTLTVQDGIGTQTTMVLRAVHAQTFAVFGTEPGDENAQGTPLTGASVEVSSENGDEAQSCTLVLDENAQATLSLLSGTYTLRVLDAPGFEGMTGTLTVGGADGMQSVWVRSRKARLAVECVDADGARVGGARLRVTDAAGNAFEMDADENGRVLSPLMEPGEAVVETIRAPEGCVPADAQRVTLKSGEAAEEQMTYVSRGRVRLRVLGKALGGAGQSVCQPLSGVTIQMTGTLADGKQCEPLTFTTDEDGQVQTALDAGMYLFVADAESVDAQYDAQNCGAIVQVTDGAAVDAELTAVSRMGGVSAAFTDAELTAEQLAQITMSVKDENGLETPLALSQGRFTALELPAGRYTLRNEKISAGYSLLADQEITVNGGAMTEVALTPAAHATLSIDRRGVTFDEKMRNYVLPISGLYGVYVEADGAYTPYQVAGKNVCVVANETGEAGVVSLPAAAEGTVYYLKEEASDLAPGYTVDTQFHELTLHAGDPVRVQLSATSDKGFFRLENVDAQTRAPLLGAQFALYRLENGEVLAGSRRVLDMNALSYQNEMALPVGMYRLEIVKAAPGYALDERLLETSVDFEIVPYLLKGGTVTPVTIVSAAQPVSGAGSALQASFDEAREGLTLRIAGVLTPDQITRLSEVHLTAEIKPGEGAFADIREVTIGRTYAQDNEAARYSARVAYALHDGGWQMADLRTVDGLESGQVRVDLSDAEGVVTSVAVYYFDTDTGLEALPARTVAGDVTLRALVDGEPSVSVTADISLHYVADSCDEQGNPSAAVRTEKTARAQGESAGGSRGERTYSAGVDGVIAGSVFEDENGDGLFGAQEGTRAAVSVSLLSKDAQGGWSVYDATYSDETGAYRFVDLPMGVYMLQVELPEDAMFTTARAGEAYLSSAITDTGFGHSGEIAIDSQHTSHVAHTGVIRIAQVSGRVFMLEDDASLQGMNGVTVSLRAVSKESDDAVYASTGEDGSFVFDRLVPGEYVIEFELPSGSAVYALGEVLRGDAAQDGAGARLTLEMGQRLDQADLTLERVGSVSGAVFVDADYDGVYADTESALAGASVELIDIRDGQETTVETTRSGEDGSYRFEGVRMGEYALRVTLPGDYVFTRPGEDNLISGAVGSSALSASFALQRGEEARRMNIGATIPAQLKVSVWRDESMDGLRTASEKGLAGVEITLVRLDAGEAGEGMTAMTDETGDVLFAAVSPGNYQIRYVMPDRWRTTVRGEGEEGSDVNASALAEGASDPFVLLMGETDAEISIGAIVSCTIAGNAFTDEDDNGLFDAGEEGRTGVTVELLSSTSQEVVDTTQTDETGAYAFDGVAPGRYRVRFTAAQGDAFSGTALTRARGCAPYAEENVSTTDTLTVNAGDQLLQIHAGIVSPSTLEGVFFIDSDDDGERAEDEGGLSGVTVTLATPTGRTTGMQAVSDETGRFTLSGVRPGSYTLRVALPDDYELSSQLSASLVFAEHTARSSLTQAFTVENGQQMEPLVFGALTYGKMAGQVFADRDFDGLRAQTEGGVRGAVVELTHGQDEARVATTGTDGAFAFENLAPGTYRLRVTLPDGMVYTREGVSLMARSDDRTQESGEIALAMGEEKQDLLIGALTPARIGGRAWLDADNNGRRESGEAALAGVEVTLYRVSGAEKEAMETTLTDEEGLYAFPSVLPGDYVIEAYLEKGYAFARRVTGRSRVSCMPMTDGQTAASDTLTLEADDVLDACDIGVVCVGTISGRTYLDANDNGRPDSGEGGVEGVAVEVLSQDGTLVRRVTSAQDGTYALEDIRVGTYVLRYTLPEGKVFARSHEQSLIAQTDEVQASSAAFAFAMGEEKTGCDVGVINMAQITGQIFTDNDFSGSFTQGESGVGRAVVELISGESVVATAKTDAQGSFTFARLRPGTYSVRMTLPSECLFTEDAQLRTVSGTIAQEEEAQLGTVASSALAAQGETEALRVEMGGAYRLAYPAIYTSSVSGCAFEDANIDGLYGTDEQPLAGVQVELLVQREGQTESVASAVVGEDGTYRFTYLWPGTYVVRFTLPQGYLFTRQVSGADPARNSDAYDHQGRTADTAAFTLHTGEKAEHADVGAIRPARLGDTVFVDGNANGWLDFGEAQPEGVELTLYQIGTDGTRTQAAQLFSDTYGYYRFDSLRPGDYVLRVTLPSGYAFAKAQEGGYAEIDSDIVVNGDGWGETEVIRLQSGEVRLNCDVGLVAAE